jgi:DNA-directed RNA polymerase specialized sigma24 family protein
LALDASMTSDSETASWLAALEAGDSQAAQRLWKMYYPRLVQLASRKLQGTSRRVADEEDVALSAFDSICQGLKAGRFPKVNDRDDLWRLLVTITARKAADLANHNARQKRGGGAVRGDSALGNCGGRWGSEPQDGWGQVVGSEPTPEFSCQVREELDRLLALLGEPLLVQIALAKLEGRTNDEIAAQMQVVPRTIERKLALIRQCWAGEIG